VVTCDEAETLGVNSRAELAAAEAAFQARARAEALANGRDPDAPETVFFAHDTMIGRDVTIAPNVVFGPGVTVETGATILAFSHLEGCHVSAGARIGPFARLRPGAEIGRRRPCRQLRRDQERPHRPGRQGQPPHLHRRRPCRRGANIGAGTITCNYDGVMKHRTEIGARAFIGSNAALVAPVTIGADALIGAGSTITEDVAPARSRSPAAARRSSQASRPLKLIERLRAAKRGIRH
jgi:bifunctional UDP-N-acetylglucosamine pyrophosphorylase / glucosamine-1-phosphate N-acetyltransferase